MNNNQFSIPRWLRLLTVTFVVFGATPWMFADALDHWNVVQVSTNGFQLSDVIYAKGLYLATGGGGDGGTILTSTDGLDWTVRADGRALGHSPSLVWGLAYGGGRCVTVGHFGGTSVSTNGVDWSYGKADTSALTGVAYGGGLFAAVGDSQGNVSGPGVFISANGTNWTRKTLSPSETRTFFDVAYGASKFVATAEGGYIYTSSDGEVWTRSATTNAGKIITFRNNLFILSSTAGTNLLSRDGIDWTPASTGLTNQLGKPIYASGMYIARTRNDFAISRDGTNWTQRTLSASPSGSEITDLPTIATDGRQFVTVGTVHIGWFQHNAFTYRCDPLVNVAMTNGLLTLSGVTGSNYRVEYKNSMNLSGTNNWQTLTNVTLSNGSQVISDSSNTGQRYYRGVLLP